MGGQTVAEDGAVRGAARVVVVVLAVMDDVATAVVVVVAAVEVMVVVAVVVVVDVAAVDVVVDVAVMVVVTATRDTAVLPGCPVGGAVAGPAVDDDEGGPASPVPAASVVGFFVPGRAVTTCSSPGRGSKSLSCSSATDLSSKRCGFRHRAENGL